MRADSKPRADDRASQRGRILQILIQARGDEVSLRQILGLGIAQYSARIFELRKLGFVIVNRTERKGGQTHSWFRLENHNAQLPLIALPAKAPEYPD
jgi:Helix-turn-helix domain